MGYLANAATLLIEVLFGLVAALFVLRVMLQISRADFHNPLSQFIYRTSFVVLRPLRQVLPPVGRFDVAATLVAWLVECLKVLALFAVVGVMPGFFGMLVMGLAELLALVLSLYFWLILIGVILSFVGSDARHPMVPLIAQLTAPLLRPFRRLLPPLGGFDLSPMFALLVILLARLLVVAPLRDLGAHLARG